MIKIESISVKNFRSVGNVPIVIKVSEFGNLALVHSDANGAGKTTFFVHAPCYAIKGKAYNDGSKIGSLINDRNKKDSVVELVYWSKGKHYKIIRGQKPSILKFYENDIEMDKGVDLQKEIDRTFDYITFPMLVNNLILSTNRYTPFRSLTKGQREEFIDRLFGTVLIKPMLSTIDDDIKTSSHQIDQLSSDISHLENMLSLKYQHLNGIHDINNDETQFIQHEMSTLKEEYLKQLALSKELQTTIDQLNTEFAKENTLLTQLDVYINKRQFTIQETLKKLNRQLSELSISNHCPLCKTEQTNHELNDQLCIEHADWSKQEKELSEKVRVKTLQAEKVYQLQLNMMKVQQQLNATKNSMELSIRLFKDYEKKLNLVSERNQVDTIHEDIENFKKTLAEKREEKLRQLDEQHVYMFSKKYLNDSNIRSKIFGQYLPTINQLLNKALNGMEFFRKVELLPDYTITVKSAGGVVLSLNDLSDGEQSKVDLAFILVWKKINQMIHNSMIDLFVLDETLSRFSPQSVVDFLAIVKEMLNDHKIIVVLQHPNDFIEWFDTMVTVENKDFTTVTIEHRY